MNKLTLSGKTYHSYSYLSFPILEFNSTLTGRSHTHFTISKCPHEYAPAYDMDRLLRNVASKWHITGPQDLRVPRTRFMTTNASETSLVSYGVNGIPNWFFYVLGRDVEFISKRWDNALFTWSHSAHE
ncbi:hypothetical protein T265_06537 [Opisthorchis viverrini]|uniref:Uncharacterized protein n=1 Tax=Opisthorchis viverrini TaxID=6198 RepID=A0A074ZFZ8_OPIVI|nr:hypothetical protein T265_06537 [Opisthorchis viverrini]KER26186.1 hypothetical protein T265_06537 [Opisthorchis viverrini]